ncbi:hypothetical protein OOT46_08560 [Aquabacterium sp. A7-Y]|uniref:hypothetical protein n=1 Tax=Aquabacterium sp. A7-Y TaxID=1349605 RepID=UPI00223E011D|nr:hypothetical protein [Aquabacterium sp. A7-Y]MCW7537899.1 hypothetical protein [Aquabacterium sp. A7-Y]
MPWPAFFDTVPKLRIHDPLAELLGSPDDGILEFGYADAVRLAGHSCPTVAAAYWITLRALHVLYPEQLPVRGGVRVDFRDGLRDGVNGVVASVVQLLTGAAGDTGFKGIRGRHVRMGLQRYTPGLPLTLRFTRLDNRHAVDALANLSLLPEPAGLTQLLQRCADGSASTAERAQLQQLWQARVAGLLGELAHNDGIFAIRPVHRPGGRQTHASLASSGGRLFLDTIL